MSAANEAAPVLFEDQDRAVDALRANIREGMMNQILCAPTGSGKTVIASHLISECHERRKRAVFVVDRVQLIDQTSAVFDIHGIPHGVIQADHWRFQPHHRIQLASAQTLARRRWPPDLDLIVVDEAHTVHRAVARRIAERNCVTIGLTATPFPRGLGKHYDGVVCVTTTNQLIEAGRLAPYRIFAASEPDMTGAKLNRKGEWDDAEAASRALPIVGDCVAEYLNHGNGGKFIAFGVNVAHCEELQRQFMAAGVVCALYTHRTGDAERTEILREFRQPGGFMRGLISVAALSKGFDAPDVEVVILARPLRKSLAEHVQMVGRGLRGDPANPTKVCTILDHGGNCVRFWGAMQDYFECGAVKLDDGKAKERGKSERKERVPMKCPGCAAVHEPRPSCPVCGHTYQRQSQVEHRAGALRAIAGGAAPTRERKQEVYSQLLHISLEYKYRSGWVAHKYREMFSAWPRGMREEPCPPSREIQNWIRSRQIAYSKSRRAA